MSALRRRIERALGPAGVIGIGVLSACLAFYAAGVIPARSGLDTRQAEWAQLSAARSGFAAPRTSQDSERGFFDYFSAPPAVYGALQSVFALAAAEGVELDVGEYRLVREKTWKLLRYQIAFPLKGSYPKIRRFVARTLNEVPGMSLDEISVQRESAASTAVEARIRLTIYLEDA